MKQLFTSLVGALIFTAILGPLGGHAIAAPGKSPMSISLIAPKQSFTVTATRPVTMTVHVSGIKLDLHDIGKRARAGRGHIQIYLDRIPSDAYKKVDTAHLVVVVGSPRFTFQVSRTWVKENRGHHHLILALARNNNVLYRGRTTSITVTVT